MTVDRAVTKTILRNPELSIVLGAALGTKFRIEPGTKLIICEPHDRQAYYRITTNGTEEEIPLLPLKLRGYSMLVGYSELRNAILLGIVSFEA